MNIIAIVIIGFIVLEATNKVKGKLLSRSEKLEQRFLDRVEQILLVNTALAVGLIVVVGALLNRRLNAPLQRPSTV